MNYTKSSKKAKDLVDRVREDVIRLYPDYSEGALYSKSLVEMKERNWLQSLFQDYDFN